MEQHTPAEVECVFKHFQEEITTPTARRFALEMVSQPTQVGNSTPPEQSTGRKERNRDENKYPR